MKIQLVDIQPDSIFCSERVFNFLKEQGFDVERSAHDSFSEDLLSTATLICFHPNYSEQLLPALPTLPTLVKAVQAFDSFVFEDGDWYPRLHCFEVLRDLLVQRAQSLDIREPAYVIGSSKVAQIAVAVAIYLGYSEVIVVGESQAELDILSTQVGRGFIGVKIKTLLVSDLTLQTTNSALLINTVPLDEEASLMSDLSYFNFMQREGIVLDLGKLAAKNHLLEEAEKAELRTVPTADFACRFDLSLLGRLVGERKELLESYKDQCLTKLASP